MCCPLVFEFSVGIGGFVIGLGQISFFFSLDLEYKNVFDLFSGFNCIILLSQNTFQRSAHASRLN